MENLKFLLLFSFNLNLTLLYSDDNAFILAAANGHLNILEFLLIKEASVKERNDRGKIQISIYIAVYLSNYLSIYFTIYLLIILSIYVILINI